MCIIEGQCYSPFETRGIIEECKLYLFTEIDFLSSELLALAVLMVLGGLIPKRK